jgi:hypothetical protein
MTRLVDALESGNFEQARGQLRVGDKFCCLGVASEISDTGFWVDGTYCTNNDRSYSVLTEDLVSYYGLKNYANRECIRLDNTFRDAANMNDSGKSFEEIASAIRKTYLEED